MYRVVIIVGLEVKHRQIPDIRPDGISAPSLLHFANPLRPIKFIIDTSWRINSAFPWSHLFSFRSQPQGRFPAPDDRRSRKEATAKYITSSRPLTSFHMDKKLDAGKVLEGGERQVRKASSWLSRRKFAARVSNVNPIKKVKSQRVLRCEFSGCWLENHAQRKSVMAVEDGQRYN